MTIELPPAQARKLNTLLKAGTFSSPVEVFAEGLRLIQARETDRTKADTELRREVLEGVKQVRAGKMMVLDDALVADIKAQGRERLAKSKLARRARGA